MKKSRFLNRFNVEEGQHSLFAGMTGSGKSTLLKQYCIYKWQVGRSIFVLDPKHEIAISEQDHVVKTVKELSQIDTESRGGKFRPVIFRPEAESDTPETYEQVFDFCYRLKNCEVVIDEVYSVYGGSPTNSRHLVALLTRGRSRDISVAMATQRPRFIPLFMLTETFHKFVFRLQLEDDRERIFEATGRKEFMEPPPKHKFLYYNSDFEDTDRIGNFKLAY